MREIKFRVWCEFEKWENELQDDVTSYEMCDVHTIHFGTKKIIVTKTYSSHKGVVSLKEGYYTLMQYTGLKDINDVDIYEGDIVSCNVYDTGTGEWHEQTKQVIFKDQQYVFLDGFWHLEPISSSWHSNLEVLGNIYQNKELLKSEEN